VGFYDLLKHVVTVSIGNADSVNAASGLLVRDHVLYVDLFGLRWNLMGEISQPSCRPKSWALLFSGSH